MKQVKFTTPHEWQKNKRENFLNTLCNSLLSIENKINIGLIRTRSKNETNRLSNIYWIAWPCDYTTHSRERTNSLSSGQRKKEKKNTRTFTMPYLGLRACLKQ